MQLVLVVLSCPVCCLASIMVFHSQIQTAAGSFPRVCAGDSTAHWLYKEGGMAGGCKTDNCAAKEASWAKFKVSQQVRRSNGFLDSQVLLLQSRRKWSSAVAHGGWYGGHMSAHGEGKVVSGCRSTTPSAAPQAHRLVMSLLPAALTATLLILMPPMPRCV